MIYAEWSTLREAFRDMKDLAADPIERSIRGATLEDGIRVADAILKQDEVETEPQILERRLNLAEANFIEARQEVIQTAHELQNAQEELAQWREIGKAILGGGTTLVELMHPVRQLLQDDG